MLKKLIFASLFTLCMQSISFGAFHSDYNILYFNMNKDPGVITLKGIYIDCGGSSAQDWCYFMVRGDKAHNPNSITVPGNTLKPVEIEFHQHGSRAEHKSVSALFEADSPTGKPVCELEIKRESGLMGKVEIDITKNTNPNFVCKYTYQDGLKSSVTITTRK